MMEIRRHEPLVGIAQVNPDRETALFAILLGCLARGRTTLEEFRWTPASREFSKWMQDNGFQIEEQEDRVIIEGSGLLGSLSPLQKLPSNAFARFLALCLLSRDTDTLYQFEEPIPESVLNHFACAEQSADRVQFAAPNLSIKASPGGEVLHETRVRILLQALLHEKPVEFTETGTGRDALSGMLAWFGAPIQIEVTGSEQLDEFERRLARLQGVKTERKVCTRLAPCKMLTGKDYFVPGDPSEAGALALMATLVHGSNLLIRNVVMNSGRSGFFSALKRMGANVEIVQRKERYGDQFASVKVQSVKRLQGRRLAGDTLASCIEEVPLLAVAACFADGESILRLPEHRTHDQRPILDDIANNLKLTGADVGIYEEGLVIRGREEVDSADFTPQKEHPVVSLALLALASAAHGISSLESPESLDHVFPDFPRLDAQSPEPGAKINESV